MFQTGSGKTYTMGTGLKEGTQTGVIPQVMNALFHKIERMRPQTEFQLHVSFIEVPSVTCFSSSSDVCLDEVVLDYDAVTFISFTFPFHHIVFPF